MGLNILVTGGSGLIASAIKDQLGWNHNISNPSKDMLDVTDLKSCRKLINRIDPDLIIHCAGYTSMDKAEEDRDACFLANVIGTENIAHICGVNDIPMVFFSSDAVFDGTKASPYEITDTPNPISFYGRTKLMAEDTVLTNVEKFWIIRTTGVYGSGRQNYITNAIDQLKEGKRSFSTLIDQLSTPTYVNDLVKVVQNLLDSKRYGLYHYTNEGKAKRWEVISHIADHLGINSNREDFLFSNYKVKALRPMNARLVDNTLGPNRNWRTALEEFIDGRD